MQHRYVILLLAVVVTAPALAQKLSISADASAVKSAPKAAKTQSVSLVGLVDIIPMGGAQVVLRSNNYGQVTLLPQMELSKVELNQVQGWLSQRAQVQVEGTMLTVCSERELKRDIMGCRAMDRSKPMTLTKQ